MRVAVLYSGGKDSTYTLWVALHQYEVVSLVTVLSEEDSYLYQHQEEDVAKTLAQAVGLPLVLVRAENSEEELGRLEEALRSLDVHAFLIGGLLSEYQRTKFNEVGRRVGIPCFAPLWRKDQSLLLTDLLNHFEVMLVKVASMGLTGDDLGKILDRTLYDRLHELARTMGLSAVGEGGEYETLVLNAPFFQGKVEVEGFERDYDGTRMSGVLRNLRLSSKKR